MYIYIFCFLFIMINEQFFNVFSLLYFLLLFYLIN